MKVYLSNTRDITRIQFDTIHKDRLGRVIGGSVRLETVDVSEIQADHRSWYFELPRTGVWFTAKPHATRDGQSYGALQRGKFFNTLAERDAYVAKYTADVHKRAAKAAKGVA